MSIITVDKEIIKDQQQLVWIAARRYMLGEISIEELAAVKEPYNLTMRNAIMEMAVEKQKKLIIRSIDNNVRKWLSRMYLVFMYGGK